MAELKAHEFETALDRITRQFNIFLLYGPDRGLVSERADALAGKSGIDLLDPFSVVKLDAEAIAGDPGRLLDEAQSIGLFGGKRLIWLKSAGTEKTVVDSGSRLLSADLGKSIVFLECGDLKKGTGLRKLMEGSGSAVAIPCYSDDTRALNRLIDDELALARLAIAPEARQQLLDVLGGDRAASRNELRKLALYCSGQTTVSEADVINIVGDASGISVDEAIDAVLSGNVDDFLHAAQKVIGSKIAVFLVLQGCMRQLQLLDQMRAEMDATSAGATQVVGNLGRHIHFKRKPIIEQALKTWTRDALARELNRLQSAVLQSRQRSTLEDSVALQTLLATTLQSRGR